MQAERVGVSGSTSQDNVQTLKDGTESSSLLQDTSLDIPETTFPGDSGLATDHIKIDEAEEETDTAEGEENGNHAHHHTDEAEAEKEMAGVKGNGEKDFSLKDSGEKDVGTKDNGENDISVRDNDEDMNVNENDEKDTGVKDDGEKDIDVKSEGEKDINMKDNGEKDVSTKGNGVKDINVKDKSEKEINAKTEKNPSFAENKQDDVELPLLNLASRQKTEENTPSLSARSNDPPEVSSNSYRESGQKITDPPNQNTHSSNNGNKSPATTDSSKDINTSENKTGENKRKLVKQSGDYSRVTSAVGTRARPPTASSTGQPSSRLHTRDTSSTVPAAKVRTQRGTFGITRFSNARQGKERSSRDSDHKLTKPSPSSTPRMPRATESRTSRTLMEINKRKTERTPLKKNEKPEIHSFGSSLKAGTTGSRSNETKETKQVSEESSLPTMPGHISSKARTQAENGKSTESSSKPPPGLKPMNGVIPTDGEKKIQTKTFANHTKDKGTPDKKNPGKNTHNLLNRAMLKRVASVDSKHDPAPVSQSSTELKNNTETNSIDGSHTSPESSNQSDKARHKQSLTVPSTGLGPAPSELDERASIGSRRDSVRLSVDSTSRKSVDYRLPTPHIVVPAGYGDDRPKSLLMHDDSMIRAAIPFLPVRLAVVCLVLNIVLPGSGTVVSGFSVLCGSQCRLSGKKDGRVMTVCLNLMVGVTQLATVVFLLVGWFWSLAWGVKMIILAVEHRREKRQQREKELQTLALRAFSSPANLRRSLFPPV